MSIKAILIGTIVGLVGSLLVSGILMLMMASSMGLRLADMASYRPSDVVLIVDLVLSLACVFAGGYVAGRLGPQRPTLNSILAGAFQLLVLALTYTIPGAGSTMPLWYTVATIVLLVPASFVGSMAARQ